MSIIIPPPPGACPSCESIGDVGQPCQERVCQRQGVHFIPKEYAEAAWQSTSLDREPLVGQFIGDFLVLGRRGKGGFGRVLLALQRPLFRMKVAVKLIEVGGHDSATARRIVDKFENEAAVLAVLNHPNIVRLLHYGSHHDRPYLAMEFVPGGHTLQTVINRLVLEKRALDPTVLKHVLHQVLDGLEAAHQQNIIHRDIKPENIMLHEVVGNPNHVKLLDFGIAKVIEQRRDTSMVMGTVHYMAPEQIEGKDLGPWTDLYALAGITFEFMTGHRAFSGDDPQVILHQKLTSDFDPAEVAGPIALPQPAAEFFKKALARKPRDRYRSTDEFRGALDKAFLAFATTAVFAQDMSKLLDSEEISRLREEQQKLEAARRAIDDERKQIEVARRELEADRQRFESSRLGLPADVESRAFGKTIAIPSVAEALAAASVPSDTTGLPTGRADPRVPTRPRPGARNRFAWFSVLAVLVLVAAFVMLPRLGQSDAAVNESGAGARTATTEHEVAGEAPAAAPHAQEPPAAIAGGGHSDRAPAEARLGADSPPVGSTSEDAVSSPDGDGSEAAGRALAAESGPVTPAPRRVNLESSPRARVVADKVNQGFTPLTLELPPDGALPRLRFVAGGHRPLEIQLTPQDLAAGVLAVRLERLPAKAPSDDPRPVW